jgi:hypothetical protein
MPRFRVRFHRNSHVVFEISAPTVSSLRNLQHNILLEKKDNSWKIVSDHYEDELWRFIRQSKLSTPKLIELIVQKEADQKQLMSSGDFNTQNLSTTSLDTGELTYNRVGASDYADKWALDRNPEYDDFGDEDCTNFVSQAIHEGGGAPMVSGDESGEGAPGWYYNNINDRVLAWTWVDGLYNFIVNEKDFWSGGPEGVEETNLLNLNKGDIVQFKWSDDDPYWMHSVIIVGWEQSGGNLIHLFDSHSSNRYHYPLESISYFQRRLIRITRVEGYQSSLPVVLSDGFSATGASSTTSSDSSPVINFLPPYPAPVALDSFFEQDETKEIEPTSVAYPAP